LNASWDEGLQRIPAGLLEVQGEGLDALPPARVLRDALVRVLLEDLLLHRVTRGMGGALLAMQVVVAQHTWIVRIREQGRAMRVTAHVMTVMTAQAAAAAPTSCCRLS